MSSCVTTCLYKRQNNFREDEYIMKTTLTLKSLKATNEVFLSLCCLRRWTSFVTEDKYNELCKQSLNCIVAYILAAYAEEAGKVIQWERFPKIAIYRAYQKAYVYYDTPEHIIDEICKIGKIERDQFNKVTEEIIGELTDDDFAHFISDGIGTYEYQIYRAATKISTYIELIENQRKINGDYIQKTNEVIKSLEPFADFPGVSEIIEPNSDVFEILQEISKLRNQNRWASHAYQIECSVLGHLFDTAVFAYFMSLEQNPNNEEMASRAFFMGIFHDVAETWTKDIPSPIKDRIPGFRAATEEFELTMLQKHFYNKVPDFLKKALKKVMFEEEGNQEFKKLLKGADYLSADSECWRQYIAGSRDKYFLEAIEGRKKGIKEGRVLLTPECEKLYNLFLNSLKKG